MTVFFYFIGEEDQIRSVGKVGNEGLLNLSAVNLPANDLSCCENARKNTNMIVRVIKALLRKMQKLAR